MGLMVYAVRFPGGAPPPEDEFRRELAKVVGSIAGLDGYEVEGDRATVATTVGPVLGPYALKLLLDRGGQAVDPLDGTPGQVRLPSFVQRPWKAWPWHARMRIHLGFHLGFLRPPWSRGPRGG
jgi:hypothetical protein